MINNHPYYPLFEYMCKEGGFDVEKVLSKSRKAAYVIVRQAFCVVVGRVFEWDWGVISELKRFLGKKDHATIIYAKKEHDENMLHHKYRELFKNGVNSREASVLFEYKNTDVYKKFTSKYGRDYNELIFNAITWGAEVEVAKAKLNSELNKVNNVRQYLENEILNDEHLQGFIKERVRRILNGLS